jgi:hypothetical protein
VVKDRKQGPRNGGASRQVAFRGGESVTGGRGFEEEERQKDKDLGPNSCRVCACVDTESLESGKHDEDSGPAVPEGEGQVNKEFVADGFGHVNLFNDIIDVGHGRSNEEGKNEG